MSEDDSQGTGRTAGLIPYEPGKSGNPGGRPKWVSETRESLKRLVPGSVARLEKIINEGEDKDANAAIRLLWDFTIRKPRQTHRVEGRNGDPLGVLTPEQLVAFITGKKEGA